MGRSRRWHACEGPSMSSSRRGRAFLPAKREAKRRTRIHFLLALAVEPAGPWICSMESCLVSLRLEAAGVERELSCFYPAAVLVGGIWQPLQCVLSTATDKLDAKHGPCKEIML